VKADPFPIGDVLKNPRRFVVPIYQRTYAWNIKPQLETFFAQLAAKAEERLRGNGHFPHYMGALLLVPRGTFSFGRMEVLDVVDGQQRLTTFQIFVAALRDLARTMQRSSTAELLDSFILNPEGPQLRDRIERYKLYPTAYDRKLYCDLIDLGWEDLRKKYPQYFYKNGKVLESAELPLRAWGFFRTEAEAFVQGNENLQADSTQSGSLNRSVSRTRVPFGKFRGQRALIVSYLEQTQDPVMVDRMVDDLAPNYESTLSAWAKTSGGGVRGSIRYHLRELEKLGQIKLSDSSDVAVQPSPEALGNPELSTEIQAARLDALSAALLESFQVIVITLNEHDDAQVIFETLNAGGQPLAAMDLVRNDVFHRATRSGEDVELLMENRWRTFEDPFWKEAGTRGRIKKPRIDFFLSDTLTAETGQEIPLTELYARYKSFVAARRFPSVDAELGTLLRHAPTYRNLVKPTGQTALAELGRELNVFDVTTAYPLIFVIESSDVPEDVRAILYRWIMSYVVRRMICGLTAKNYNNVFLRLASDLRAKGVSLVSAAAAFGSLDGDTVRFPDDDEFRTAIGSRRVYGNIQQHRLQHILSHLETEARDRFDESTSLPIDLTIEHVMPDVWWEHWPLSDGTKAPSDLRGGMTETQLKLIEERERCKHTLGNLTLLSDARNPSLGNLGFPFKREKLRQSLLKLNHEIAEEPDWNEKQITQRATRLANLAIKIWPDITRNSAEGGIRD